eukprot:SM000098S25153  [mRNA]  locus=s98:474320:479179:- [translate_table: standard]
MASEEDGPDGDGGGGGGGGKAGLRDTDLYALLHVPRDASDDDLKRAYRRWAQTYHPDKYLTPQMQEVAKHNFQRIREAYEVLSDPARRQVYDVYGWEGLAAGVELGPRLRTREEIGEELARLTRQARERRHAARVNHSGSLLTSLTLEDMLRGLSAGPKITGMVMSTQVQAQTGERDLLVLGGTVVAKRSLGGGTLMTVFRRQLSPQASWEVLATAGMRSLIGFQTSRHVWGPFWVPATPVQGLGSCTLVLFLLLSLIVLLQMMGFSVDCIKSSTSNVSHQFWDRQLSSHSTGTLGLTYNLQTGGLGLTNQWTRQLSSATNGNINLTCGADSSVGIGWQHNGRKFSVAGDLKVGMTTFGLSAQVNRQFSAASSGHVVGKFGSAQSSPRASSNGIDVEVGGSRRISGNSTAGLYCIVGIQGILWKVRYTRGGQKFVLPILLSSTLRPMVLLGAFILPTSLYFLLKQFVLKPFSLERSRRKTLEQRKANAVKVGRARATALEAQSLMAPVAVRKQRKELEKGGVVITSAVYGNLQPPGQSDGRRVPGGQPEALQAEDRLEENGGAAGDLPPPYLDVQTPLQFLIDDAGFLLLHAGTRKAGLMGFCDPCPGEEKQLRVRYTWQGQPHQVVVGDLEELRVPQEAHRVPNAASQSGSLHAVD